MNRRLIVLWILVFVAFGGPLTFGQVTAERFPLPEASYDVRVEQNVMVPMRDGVRLATDLYFPDGGAAGERFPVLLWRTPYNKDRWNRDPSFAYFYARHGYVVAVQDVRGRFASEGAYLVSAADTEDGYDMTTWAAAQPWSTGNVGMAGCSYPGENQIETAKLRHPRLKALLPHAAGGAARYFGVLAGGAIELATGFGWFYQLGSKTRPHFKSNQINFRTYWESLPLLDIVRMAGTDDSDWEDFVSHEPADPWWDQFGYVDARHRFDVPALHVNSWYDLGVKETLDLFNLLSDNAESPRGRDNQFVIISPTSHCRSQTATAQTIVGERDLGDARFPYQNVFLAWYDHWLKGIDNGITDMPPVQLYVMGKNAWRAENEWPLARTQYTNYYLHSDGQANSRNGTGTLSTEQPADEPPDHYTYDPADPVPSKGGPVCCTGTPDAPEGAYDQRDVELRHDVLVYTTPPLDEGVEVTGPLEVVLYVSSSAKDTDFTAKLVDVYPDGTAYNVQEGILRARYREGFDKKVWMEDGDVYEVRINLFATSNYFGPGHRIRLEVSSSNFPRFDRNLNTGGSNYDETEWVKAENTIHHSAAYPSRLIVPVIPQ